MSQEVQLVNVNKKRQRRSPEMIAQLIWEAERNGNVAEICRRENVTPSLLYRWRQRHKEAGIAGLNATKRGPKSQDPEKEALQLEVERLKQALRSANIADYNRENVEVQGLELWLSGVGRATGNARTERTIGTLKREEIYLQGFHSSVFKQIPRF